MPKESLNVYLTITDKASPSLASIGDKVKALDKETQQLEQTFEALRKANEPLIKRQVELEKKLADAKNEAKDAAKAFKNLGDAASEDAYEKAKQHQIDIRQQLTQTNNALKENEAIYRRNMETIRKGSTAGGTLRATLGNIATGLIAGQVGGMFASALGGLGESVLTSAIGTPEASVISDTLSSAIAGAAMGSIIPGLGTAIGAGIGALSGLLTSGTQIFEAKDDAFKEYYNSLYEAESAAMEDMISSGSTLAGSREQTRMAFAKKLGGEDEADAYLERVKTMAAHTNYDYDEITGYSKLLLNTYAPDEVFGVLQSLSDATAGLSLSSSDVEVMISGLSRMRTTGKTTQEYLNYFSERGVDVYTALAEALDVDKSQIAGMVTDGDIEGSFAAEAILNYIDDTYGGLSEDLMGTYDALSANLEDVLTNIEATGGEGYNEMRKSGLDAEISAYGGPLGDALSEANRIVGENKAYLENLSEQYEREALSALLLGEQTTLYSYEQAKTLADMRQAYLDAQAAYEAGDQEAGLTMESLLEEARTMATTSYESSDAYQAKMDAELEEISSIRRNTDGMLAALNSYHLGQEQSKGRANAWTYVPTDDVREKVHNAGGFFWSEIFSSHAYGLDRVPYDEYPALLHEGERVKTASEARAEDARAGKPVQVIISGNSFNGTSEEMADQLWDIFATRLEQAAVVYGR